MLCFKLYTHKLYKNKKASTIIRLSMLHLLSRGDWIRTSDHTPPRRVLQRLYIIDNQLYYCDFSFWDYTIVYTDVFPLLGLNIYFTNNNLLMIINKNSIRVF